MRLLNMKMYLLFLKKIVFLKLLKIVYKFDFEGRIDSLNKSFHGYEGCYSVKDFLCRIEVTKNDKVLDVGCGKGLFFYYASMFKFGAIDGVEISSEFAKVAKKNANLMGDNRIHVYNEDALNFGNYEAYNYFFFNNPFSSEVTEKVVKKIIESQERVKRTIFVLYQFPFNCKIFLDYGFKVEFDKFPNMMLTRKQ